ncbi:MAG: hypothetical protein WBO23_13635 [Burkholderiales bacterium]
MEQITRIVLLVTILSFALSACNKSKNSGSAAPAGASELSWDQGNWNQQNWQ